MRVGNYVDVGDGPYAFDFGSKELNQAIKEQFESAYSYMRAAVGTGAVAHTPHQVTVNNYLRAMAEMFLVFGRLRHHDELTDMLEFGMRTLFGTLTLAERVAGEDAAFAVFLRKQLAALCDALNINFMMEREDIEGDPDEPTG